ncbi:Uncharacterized protein TCM_028657 [Theobroma cacao]|uniref:Secreted protein n=1 Tax=Theobroma cacao TaxID=3641 RepID=A0A061GAW1_THECC|nr:Uncharacterized protein TCM_028657 [Theobroma cacao]
MTLFLHQLLCVVRDLFSAYCSDKWAIGLRREGRPVTNQFCHPIGLHLLCRSPAFVVSFHSAFGIRCFCRHVVSFELISRKPRLLGLCTGHGPLSLSRDKNEYGA